MRTTKQERQSNAKRFFNTFRQYSGNTAAIVIDRKCSSNPNISRCQFMCMLPGYSNSQPVIIAESVDGITGCFMEFISSFHKGKQKGYYEDGFNAWLADTFGFRISYADGLVIVLERCR